MTLNLLRPARLHPQLSAYAMVHGAYDYSSQPIMRVLVHDLPNHRKSWAPHASEGFYLGPALNHYRCFRVLNPTTNAKRISETVRWMPHSTIQVPTPTPDDLLRISIQDFITTLRTVKPQQLPHLSQSGKHLLQHLFQTQPLRVASSTFQPPPSPRLWMMPPPLLSYLQTFQGWLNIHQGWRHLPSNHHLHLFQGWRHPMTLLHHHLILYRYYLDPPPTNSATSFHFAILLMLC